MDLELLEGLGLTKAEIKVYVSLLEIGKSSSGNVIERSGLQSSVVHRVLKTLAEKGLIGFVKVGKDRQYQAASPNYLLTYLDEKKKAVEEVIPALLARQEVVKEPLETEMVVGQRAVFTLLTNLIADAKPKEEYVSFSLAAEHESLDVVRFYRNFNVRRWEKKLNVRVLANSAVKPIFERNYERELLRKAGVRYTAFNFPQGIIVFRNKTLFLNWEGNPTAILVTSEQMARQFRRFFYDLYARERDAYATKIHSPPKS